MMASAPQQQPQQHRRPEFGRSLSHEQRHTMLLAEANRRASLQFPGHGTSGIRTSASMVHHDEITLTIPEEEEANRVGIGKKTGGKCSVVTQDCRDS